MACAPGEYGPSKTIYNRFIRWSRMGVFNKIFASLAAKGGKPDQLMIDAFPKAKALLGDKGYDADWFREALAKRKISACIPSKANRKVHIPHDAVLSRRRHKSRICSGNSRTGTVSTHDTTAAPTPSSPQSVSQQPPSSGSINES